MLKNKVNLISVVHDDAILWGSINETTSTAGTGAYRVPMSPGLKLWDKTSLEPFIEPVSDYVSSELQYDSYDGIMDSKNIKTKEHKAIEVSKKIKKMIQNQDDDGLGAGMPSVGTGGESSTNVSEIVKKIKQLLKDNSFNSNNINEATHTSVTSGVYTGPTELGLKKWRKSELSPFTETSSHESNYDKKNKTLKDNIKKVVGVWEKGKDKTYDIPTHYVHVTNESHYDRKTLVEDLAVWFGTKKKPKGSKQPKGPWVNICRKVDGKHPPCGRSDTSKGAYPKCRAAGVAGKMSASQKKAACAQKRRAEKKDTQSGKGQKPVMTSYKPKKESLISKKVINEKFKIEPNEREKLYEDDNFLLVAPLTHTASCKYGANTKWCTTSSDDVMFDKHDKMGSLAYLIIKNKELQDKLESGKFGLYMNKPGENYLGGRYPGPDGIIFYDEKNDVLSSNKIMNLFDRHDMYGKFMNIIQKFVTYSFDKFKKLDSKSEEPKY